MSVAPALASPRHIRVSTPLGSYLIAAEGPAITGIWREGQKHFPAADRLGALLTGPGAEADALLADAAAQLHAYLSGGRTDVVLPLAPRGTAFQQRVWERLQQIPRGETTTYGQIARDLEAPKAAQAVGSAVGSNPISIVIPCHRVLSSTGALTGYAGGVETKQALLALEGITPPQPPGEPAPRACTR